MNLFKIYKNNSKTIQLRIKNVILKQWGNNYKKINKNKKIWFVKMVKFYKILVLIKKNQKWIYYKYKKKSVIKIKNLWNLWTNIRKVDYNKKKILFFVCFV